jgi:ribosomal-protein-alanine N-acetyltransferase
MSEESPGDGRWSYGLRESSPQSPVPVSVRPLTPEDLDQVVAIERESFPHPWTVDHFRDELNSPHAFPLAAVGNDGSVAGFICPFLVLDEGHILDVAVGNTRRGEGIGGLLVETALRLLRERGALRVSLEVRTSNAPAISLYRRLGFEVSGLRKRYYENGEDALLMDITFG